MEKATVKRMNITTSEIINIKIENIVDMGLGFSAMMRLYKEETKKDLRKRVLKTVKEVFTANSKADFDTIHSNFCRWGIENVTLAGKKNKNGNIIKEGPASYGQIAKTFDVVMKVVIYYSQLPECQRSETILPWLNPAVDNKMMKMLKRHFKENNRCLIENISPWPNSLKKICERKYQEIQKLVREFIKEKHDNKILPIQFDDIYWNQLNR